MKKVVTLLLAVCMLVAILAGCGNKPTSDAANPSQETSTGKEETSNSTTESTQATDTEETTVPDQESATTPSEENSTKPTEKPIEPTNPTETTKPVHAHSYSAATCTQAKKCSCGATSGSSLGHKWTNATCTTPKTCSVCKVTEGNAAGHSWSNATCTTPKTCSVCKATEGNAAGHSWSNATCTTPKACSVCKVTEGNAAGHSWSDATCTAPKTCTKCGATEGEMLPHSYQDGKCKTCDRRQLGVGRWAAFALERNEYIGTDLDVTWISSTQNTICGFSYIDMETIDPELLKELQQMDCSIVTYQGKQYIEYAGAGDDIYYEEVSEEAITVCILDSTDKFTLKRLSDTEIVIVDVVGCGFLGLKTGMIFAYQD